MVRETTSIEADSSPHAARPLVRGKAEGKPSSLKKPISDSAASAAQEDEDAVEDSDATAFRVEKNEGANDTITVLAHVKEKIIAVHCGFGTQQVIWLGHVAIARYGEDDENDSATSGMRQGWMDLGIPIKIVKDGKHELRMTDLICDVLPNSSHVYISTSLG